eukprot:scaffold2329_cov247-Pinguiococcus_pyrenoidosus.AAC.23
MSPSSVMLISVPSTPMSGDDGPAIGSGFCGPWTAERHERLSASSLDFPLPCSALLWLFNMKPRQGHRHRPGRPHTSSVIPSIRSAMAAASSGSIISISCGAAGMTLSSAMRPSLGTGSSSMSGS